MTSLLARFKKPPYSRRPARGAWVWIATFFTLLFVVGSCHSATCVGQLSLWTPTEHTSETHQWIQPAARAEVSCSQKDLKFFGRGDLYTIPGKIKPDINNAGAYEGWAGTSLRVYGNVQVAAFAGIHGALSSDAIQGGTSASFCGGFRLDTDTDYSVGGVCSSYKSLGPGVALVFTNVVTVKGAIGVATNMAYIPSTGRRLLAVGPTVSWR